jgi:carbamoyl-phosphate synthase large subunit
VSKIGEQAPNVVDVIEAGSVDLVINTMSGTNGANASQAGAGRPVMKDGFEIRRAAVERRIPCLTSLDTAAALLESAVTAAGDLEVRTITEWREGVA